MPESAQVPHPEERPAQQVAVTSASYEDCLARIEPAAAAVFGADPRVRALGIAPHPDGRFGFAATRNVQAILPQGAVQPVHRFETIPVTYNETFGEINCLAVAPALPSMATQVPETLMARPLVCGFRFRTTTTI
jgi:hypothetical protein